MSQTKNDLIAELQLMGFDAPKDYTITQLRKKKAELEKSYAGSDDSSEGQGDEATTDSEATETQTDAEDAPEVTPEANKAPDDKTDSKPEVKAVEPVKEETSFTATSDFTFRGKNYVKDKSYPVTPELYKHFDIHGLVG